MNTAPNGGASVPRRYKRILVALDWGCESTNAVEEVTALAVRLRAELRAMFVEDVDLLRLTEYPHVQAFGFLSTSGQQLGAEQLRKEMRMRLARSRRAIEDAAAQRQLKCAFEVRQGRALNEALGAAGDEDLVVVSWISRGGSASSWHASLPPAEVIARALGEAHARSVLLLHPNAPKLGPVLVGYDGSDQSKAALYTAILISDVEVSGIEIALLTNRLAEIETWTRDIRRMTSELSAPLRFWHLPTAKLDELCRAATSARAHLLAFGAALALNQGENARRALERVSCSVLLAR